jgi:hypothetical protein
VDLNAVFHNFLPMPLQLAEDKPVLPADIVVSR